MNNPADRVLTLRQQIARHEYHYYVEANPQISDAEFDRLMAELQEIERAHPDLIVPDSPTQRVGGVATAFETVVHRVPMMSLDNTYSMNDLADWVQRMEKAAGSKVFPIVAELKIDGVSASITYKAGKFAAAATRGDGKTGDLVSGNVKTIKSLPLKIASSFDMDLRGEIYVPRATLEKLNQGQIDAGLEPFKNCRNLAAGTLKSLDPKVASQRGLRLLVYGVAQAQDLGFKKHSEVLAFLSEQGFSVNHPVKLCRDFEDLAGFLKEVEATRDTFDFDIDGVVLKVDDLMTQTELGSTSKAPRWAAAFKFAQRQAVTRLNTVTWQVGRGQITPVANLEPVELGGTTVSRASLHNLDQIREKDIRIGDFVRVEKAGYIIPYVVESLKDRRTGHEILIVPPSDCPACGQETEISRAGETIGGAEVVTTQVRCINPDCRGVLSRRINYFVSQLEIENMGPQIIDKLVSAGFLSEISDVFRLRRDDVLKVERMGEKLADKILVSIAKARKASLAQLIASLGIPNVGKVAAESLAMKFPDFASFRDAKGEELKEIFGVGEKVADTVQVFLGAPKNQKWLDELAAEWQGPDPKQEVDAPNRSFLGKLFVVTGEAGVPRRQIEEFIKVRGGRVSSGVSTKTHFLVIGSLESDQFESTKKAKALDLGIPIIDEKELFKMG